MPKDMKPLEEFARETADSFIKVLPGKRGTLTPKEISNFAYEMILLGAKYQRKLSRKDS